MQIVYLPVFTVLSASQITSQHHNLKQTRYTSGLWSGKTLHFEVISSFMFDLWEFLCDLHLHESDLEWITKYVTEVLELDFGLPLLNTNSVFHHAGWKTNLKMIWFSYTYTRIENARLVFVETEECIKYCLRPIICCLY